jgi:vancomycin resistance protein VanJ
LFWWGWGLFGLAVVTLYGLSWWPGDRLLPVRLFHYFMPWLLTGLIPGLLIAGLFRRRWVTLALAAPALLIGLTFAPLFLPQPNGVLAAGYSFKVMSFNVHYHNRNIAEVTDLIRQEQPDILLIQELGPTMARLLNDKLADLYPDGPLYLVYEREADQGIFSRFPLTQVELVYDEGSVQKAIATTPAGPITVWNVHPQGPLIWRRHDRQLSGLAGDIAAVNGPLIVGGDFNTTDQSETYRLVSQFLKNAHWEAGWGFGFSFPAPQYQRRFRKIPVLTPIIRIDHIFYSHHFFVRNARTLGESAGSDHLPVTAQLSLVK